MFTLSFGQQVNYEKDQLLIQLYPEANPSVFIRQVAQDQNLEISKLELISAPMNVYLISFADETVNLDKTINALYGYNEVILTQKNYFVSDRETIPDDALFSSLWHLKNEGLDGGTVDADIDATDAWDITTGGLTTHNDTIVVCVVEGGGVDITHEDLVDNIWHNYAEIPDNGIDDDGNGYIDDFDGWNVQSLDDAVGFGSHGTRVSGMIGAKGNNGVGVSGVNWDVKMMVVKGQQASNEASVIAAYTYPLIMRKKYNESFGNEGAFVVATNSSWGLDGADPADSPIWCSMYDSLGMYGVISIGATTNNNLNVDEVGDMPTGCTSDYFIGVTMSNNVDLRAGSGYGTTSVDIAAPGNSVRLPVPGDVYTTTLGTSFAAPCVTGAVALTYSAPCADFINLVKYDPSAAALQMRDYIFDGVDPIVSLGSEVSTGGRLNVKNSIDLLMADCDEDACISPYDLRAEDITDSVANIVWAGFTDDYVLTIQEDGMDPVTISVEGETELNFDTLKPCTEYTITIQSLCIPDELSEPSFELIFITDGCCTNPPMASSEITEESMDVSWDDVLYATQYNVRYSKIGEEDWTELTDVEAPISIDGLEACTEYEFQIHTVCGDSTRGYGESDIFRTTGCGVCTELEYCAVTGGGTLLEWIDTIFINGAIEATGDNDGWLISEEIITALTPGESYLVRIVPGYAGSAFTEHHSIYIDFNQNGEFDMGTEDVLFDHTINGPALVMITIPESAEIGVTKIRFAMSALTESVACRTDSFSGEYEDYCVYIGPQLSVPEEELPEIKIYPNPVSNELYIETEQEIGTVSIYSNDGKLVLQPEYSSNSPINTSSLSNGIYMIQFATENASHTLKFIKQ